MYVLLYVLLPTHAQSVLCLCSARQRPHMSEVCARQRCSSAPQARIRTLLPAQRPSWLPMSPRSLELHGTKLRPTTSQHRASLLLHRCATFSSRSAQQMRLSSLHTVRICQRCCRDAHFLLVCWPGSWHCLRPHHATLPMALHVQAAMGSCRCRLLVRALSYPLQG